MYPTLIGLLFYRYAYINEQW